MIPSVVGYNNFELGCLIQALIQTCKYGKTSLFL